MAFSLGSFGPDGPCDCCGPAPVLACCPCSIPQADLTVNYESTGPAGNGSMTLVYTPAGTLPDQPTPVWLPESCIDLGVLTLPSGDAHCWLTFWVSCFNGTTTFESLSWYQDEDTGCTDYPFTSAIHCVLAIDSFTCSPFHFHTDVDFRAGFPSSVLNEANFTSIDLDSPFSVPGYCVYNFTLHGCSDIPAEGVSLGVWTDATKATLVGTGTTDANGDVQIVGTQRLSNGHCEASGSRFSTASGNGVTPNPGSSSPLSLSPASGYRCTTLCAWPIPEMLHATHPVFGPIAYAYSGGAWTAVVSYDHPGYGTCPARTVTVTCSFDEFASYSESWDYDGSGCPDDSGGNPMSASWNFDPDALACYVPGVSGLSIRYIYFVPGGGAEENLYQVSGMIELFLTE